MGGLILWYDYLSRFRKVFLAMAGLSVAEFDDLVGEMLPRYHSAEVKRLRRPNRQRAIGGGHHFELCPRAQILLTVVWLRQWPTYEVLGYLFGGNDATISRYIGRLLSRWMGYYAQA